MVGIFTSLANHQQVATRLHSTGTMTADRFRNFSVKPSYPRRSWQASSANFFWAANFSISESRFRNRFKKKFPAQKRVKSCKKESRRRHYPGSPVTEWKRGIVQNNRKKARLENRSSRIIQSWPVIIFTLLASDTIRGWERKKAAAWIWRRTICTWWFYRE